MRFGYLSKLKIKHGRIYQLKVLTQITVTSGGAQFFTSEGIAGLLYGENTNSPGFSIESIRAVAQMSPEVVVLLGSDAHPSIKGTPQIYSFLELMQLAFSLQHVASQTGETANLAPNAVFLSDGDSFNNFQVHYTKLDQYRATILGILEVKIRKQLGGSIPIVGVL